MTMAAGDDEADITAKVLQDLQDTPYAASSLSVLSGGHTNFIYRATLLKPLDDGAREVAIKHSEDYVASSPSFRLTLQRCHIEEECLRALSKLHITGQTEPGEASGYGFVVRTPELHRFSAHTNSQVQEYLPHGTSLKTYALKTYAAAAPETQKRQCTELGRALGRWLRGFHEVSVSTARLRDVVAANAEMRRLKHMLNFSRLLQRVERFPAVLGDARPVFDEVAHMAAREMEDEGSMTQVIHGDFWPGNILLPSRPIDPGAEIPVFVIDWEMAQLGARHLDVGQMVAELYELKLFKDITAGLWMVQGFLAGYGAVSEAFAFRTAIQAGAHLVCFGTSTPGWGSPEKVEMVARTGKEIIVRAWKRDRGWFESGDLACLFASVG
ncbi:kinase-like domain-containing protein [Xylariomycetidae sp. FL2044]|nr:kinase-like domain-containing protein [Xylariomycetidae sp. FL2044]